MRAADTPILVVEDNEDDVLLIERAARQARIANPLRIVADGDLALAYLEGMAPFGDRLLNPAPRLMLLDLKLPKRSGFEVLQWLRAHPSFRRLPVVVLTSSGQEGDINRAYELGANAYLVKPVKFDDLRDLLTVTNSFWLQHAHLPPS